MEWKYGVEGVGMDSLDANRSMIDKIFVLELEILFVGLGLRGRKTTRNKNSGKGSVFIIEAGFEKIGDGRGIALGTSELDCKCLNALGIGIRLVKRETFGEEFKVDELDVEASTSRFDNCFDLVSIVDFGIGFVDPSDINNIEFGAPIINANEAIVLMKWDLYGIFDFVERGVRRDSMGNADKAMMRAFKDFVFKEVLKIVVIHF